jgi:hypothetical protein
MQEIKDIAQRYNVQGKTSSMAKTLVSGGSILELGNGIIIAVDQELDTFHWAGGDNVTLLPHPSLTLPYVGLLSDEHKAALVGKIIAQH